jgi:hypothetical protein
LQAINATGSAIDPGALSFRAVVFIQVLEKEADIQISLQGNNGRTPAKRHSKVWQAEYILPAAN